ncbi:dienelactone hydrolase family protein [Rhodoblastus acidophilus]|uniref:Dienelactone hydrolase family protein n=1 Tax=Candidatus Rhodoblastus alkanivorans TaxID=2954117 RepID=A0ABS9ZA85_9HYPH|nr:alpha/beta family hydrolase [Candidatus Rhodoblastus alkanivorans]MCI4679830.1 dienelactone hydrolase family protein [Candidatus Rhodoblastus alkanivorans]MCI4684336.1 dienelactone hydrolase family protein [Candidatus Rhodoblastus alkanivorans]MDI4641657.1 dienelactone hydrolase family protein [Rhodoblastus acidophilus]
MIQTATTAAEITLGREALPGLLAIPADPRGLVLFAHGSGSSRFSPRNRQVADALNAAGYATLLFDLLTEEEAQDRRKVFDIQLLGCRLVEAIDWAREDDRVFSLPFGLFGASTGAAAAILAAVVQRSEIAAVVSRGGRPDLAGSGLEELAAPILFIVGGDDDEVLEFNRAAQKHCHAKTQLRIIPGATHLFEEPGALDQVVEAAALWFDLYLRPRPIRFDDREAAGRVLARALVRRAPENPVVYALPRGGVPVAAPIARALGAPLDLILARKIGTPGNPELALGAAVDGEKRDIVINHDIAVALHFKDAEIQRLAAREFAEIERRRRIYLGDAPPVSAHGRAAVVVDDGVATGASMEAALRAVRRRDPQKIILALPVAPPDSLERLMALADETVCLATPANFFGVGQFYRNFHQIEDDQVIRTLAEFSGRR